MEGELVVEHGPRTGLRYKIRLGQRFVIGRGPGVSIDLDDERVSRRHAEVELRPDGWLYVRDLASRNGSTLHGRDLDPHNDVRLGPGDRLGVGGAATIRIELTGEGGPEPASILPSEEFEVLGQLGRGGTGRVYAARQRLLDRMVAIKLLHVDEVAERERILREARLAMRIKSPDVIQVFDVRVYGDHLCMVMEMINGPNLASFLTSGRRVQIPQALALGENLAHGLATAHAAGLIHRDLKPANVLISPIGIAKLMDFGLAVDLESRGGARSLSSESLVSESLPYMAPEQAAGEKLDERADVYSLAATVFQLIGGEPPFHGRSLALLLERIQAHPPSDLCALDPACPREVADYLCTLLDRNVAARPAASDVVRGLEGLRAKHFPDFVAAHPTRRTGSPQETKSSSLALRALEPGKLDETWGD